MARRLKLNESTVRKKILALRKKGLIRRFLVDVDAVKLGYSSNAMLGVDVDPAKMMEVGKKLALLPDARLVYSVSGENDFHVVIWTKDRESINKVVEHVSALEGVVKVTPNFTLERLK